MLPDQFTTAVNACPDCGQKLDACTAVEDGTVPGEGDLSVCYRCGGLALFNADLTLRTPTPQETFELASSFKVQQIVQTVKRMAHERGR